MVEMLRTCDDKKRTASFCGKNWFFSKKRKKSNREVIREVIREVKEK